MAQEHEAQATAHGSAGRDSGAGAPPAVAGGAAGTGVPAEVALAQLAAAQAQELAPLREEVARLTQALEQLRAEHAQLQQQALAAHRRALVAEHRGQVVEDLIRGETLEELEASVARARAAWEAVAQAVRQEALVRVPPGAGPAPEPEAEALTPLGKIAAALRARA